MELLWIARAHSDLPALGEAPLSTDFATTVAATLTVSFAPGPTDPAAPEDTANTVSVETLCFTSKLSDCCNGGACRIIRSRPRRPSITGRHCEFDGLLHDALGDAFPLSLTTSRISSSKSAISSSSSCVARTAHVSAHSRARLPNARWCCVQDGTEQGLHQDSLSSNEIRKWVECKLCWAGTFLDYYDCCMFMFLMGHRMATDGTTRAGALIVVRGNNESSGLFSGSY